MLLKALIKSLELTEHSVDISIKDLSPFKVVGTIHHGVIQSIPSLGQFSPERGEKQPSFVYHTHASDIVEE